ncbi:xanthine dehydrogenase family protein molybdopterin-binding subunit [Pseudoflavonifractor sp. MSJ-37]|uniref:xanthine dehydrogenase family protein molybdopterin-binding subunit n=1 Tax=Pseudoflavonifractor sp. MSJ-37 TaxID=2841531 RepID=UPI001C11E3F0|nr:xanthine dehydrogenase family protein molybdopterin-binding subunit [Pseudoflavonifractor sp. MSJ-37]MBU5434235.1 xanthine dehydrogenase family protein molybdopterin-binding subunit [Pseudoflavonifractor sp. MSJ-37]
MANHRKDVFAKVTGKAIYANDIKMPGMVFCKVVRSTIASGKILSIDSSEAEKVPGVIRIITAKDIPGIPNQPCDRPVICGDRVRYIGDAVALVAAETKEQAEEAVALVKVEYEPLPANFDPMHALDENAPLVHDSGNTICKWRTFRGDAEGTFPKCDHVIERDYVTSRVQHVCIETEAAVAYTDQITNQMIVRCPVNSPFVIRKTVAETLGVPYTQVRVVLAVIGASFGGKNYDIAMASSRAALVSHLLGCPCKVYLTREESIMEGTKRHPIHAHYKVGFNDDGKLQAMQVRLVLDGGAYKSKTFPVTTRMAIEAAGPYIVPNIDTISTSVYTNNVYSDALRGFGSPQVDFCSESLMDEIAKELGMDPVELRKRNMLYEGCTSTTGQHMTNVTLDKCWEALDGAAKVEERRKRIAEYNACHTGTKKGLGIAFLHRGESFGAAGQGIDTASGMIALQPDGSVMVASSIAEVGQGGANMLVSVVHETLGVDREKIHLTPVDTGYLTDAGPTVATRGTVFSGGAVWKACLSVREKLTDYAEKRLNTRDLIFEDESITDAKDPANTVPLLTVIGDAFNNSDHLNSLGYFAAPPFDYDRSTGVGDAYWSWVYGAAAAEVTVDLKTGSVSVDDYFAVHDVGHAMDPDEVEGQIRGGVAMGIGYALTEEVDMKEGRIRNLNLENYILPTALDVPDQIHAIALEIPSEIGPLGAKGLGEPATCNVAPAVVNAIADACGKRIRELPANLERILLGHAMSK